jgi:hypothetical protein
MATKAEIAVMTTEQKIEALPRALSKTMKKYLRGTGLDAKLMLEMPKIDKDGKPLTNFKKDMEDIANDPENEEIDLGDKSKRTSAHRFYSAKIKDFITANKGQTDAIMDQLEENLVKMPDSPNKTKVSRMFAIRKELHALETKRDELLQELSTI